MTKKKLKGEKVILSKKPFKKSKKADIINPTERRIYEEMLISRLGVLVREAVDMNKSDDNSVSELRVEVSEMRKTVDSIYEIVNNIDKNLNLVLDSIMINRIDEGPTKVPMPIPPKIPWWKFWR